MKRLIEKGLIFGKLLRYAVVILGIAVTCGVLGVLGVLTVCSASSLIPANFYRDGQCAASDKPAEVFGSVFILGLILGILAAGIFAVYRAGRNKDAQ